MYTWYDRNDHQSGKLIDVYDVISYYDSTQRVDDRKLLIVINSYDGSHFVQYSVV